MEIVQSIAILRACQEHTSGRDANALLRRRSNTVRKFPEDESLIILRTDYLRVSNKKLKQSKMQPSNHID
jgi:hypothetical protein